MPAASRATPGSVPPPATKWGDREGRRRDILAAARHQIDEKGYLALNMREVAREAGVSPGTVYSYFATKEEIFATLYAEELERYALAIGPTCASAATLEDLIVGIADPYRGCYERFGQYLNLWSVLQDPETMGESPSDLRRQLLTAAEHIRRAVEGAMARLQREQGVAMPARQPVTSLMYAVINGLCDQYTTERHLLHRRDWDTMLRFAARTLATGLTAPR
jgi:AcrR family transcriptional regulator